MCDAITSKFSRCWESYAVEMGLETKKRRQREISSSSSSEEGASCNPLTTTTTNMEPRSELPEAWTFAVGIFRSEYDFRPRPYPICKPASEDSVTKIYQEFCERFGRERVERMFGGKGKEILWTEERRMERWADQDP
jgi:hypothetical protein